MDTLFYSSRICYGNIYCIDLIDFYSSDWRRSERQGWWKLYFVVIFSGQSIDYSYFCVNFLKITYLSLCTIFKIYFMLPHTENDALISTLSHTTSIYHLKISIHQHEFSMIFYYCIGCHNWCAKQSWIMSLLVVVVTFFSHKVSRLDRNRFTYWI